MVYETVSPLVPGLQQDSPPAPDPQKELACQAVSPLAPDLHQGLLP